MATMDFKKGVQLVLMKHNFKAMQGGRQQECTGCEWRGPNVTMFLEHLAELIDREADVLVTENVKLNNKNWTMMTENMQSVAWAEGAAYVADREIYHDDDNPYDQRDPDAYTECLCGHQKRTHTSRKWRCNNLGCSCIEFADTMPF